MPLKVFVLDTQVYSNTGGQASTASYTSQNTKMSVHGKTIDGKQERRKEIAQIAIMHPRTFVAQTTCAHVNHFYRSVLDALEFDGPAMVVCYTTCQPEHGVADDMALHQAQRVRDSRGVPEFVFDPRKGESYQEALDIKGNPSIDLDWYETKSKTTGETTRYTVAHWCTTEARFRNHLKKIKPEAAEKLIHLDNMLVRITQQDVVYRRYLLPEHRSFIPDFGVYIQFEENGKTEYRALSRQLVMFCVERRKAWRMLQSKAGVVNREYQAQKALLADVEAGKVSKEDFFAHAHEMLAEKLGNLVPAKA
jgi:pyruvate-ferredoxin/flavodoxin oxidoreductase